MLSLDDPRWVQFRANYTDGVQVAKLLEQAQSGEPLDKWYDDLFQEIGHQYTVSIGDRAADCSIIVCDQEDQWQTK